MELLPVPHVGVNPRGLVPNHVWQMDITHVPFFGHMQYVHVSIDTCSHLIFASAHTGEKVCDVKSHCLQAFVYLGVPKCIKAANGPAYMCAGFARSYEESNTQHKTGIPYNPQRQALWNVPIGV